MKHSDLSHQLQEMKGAASHKGIEAKIHCAHSFEGPWMIVCVATSVPCVLDHPTKNFATELIVSERHKTNNIITFANVHVKFIK